jgi:hypothetical protein
MGVEVAHHAVDAAPPLEDLEHQLKAVACPLVRILDDLARRPAHEAARHRKAELPALGLVPASFLEAGAHDVQFRLAHRALQPEQEPVVVETGVVDTVVVADQRPGQGADFQKLVPVPAGAGEPGDLDPENQAHVAEPDLRHQTLEPRNRPPMAALRGVNEAG